MEELIYMSAIDFQKLSESDWLAILSMRKYGQRYLGRCFGFKGNGDFPLRRKRLENLPKMRNKHWENLNPSQIDRLYAKIFVELS